jgi:hypothetical protein
MNRFLSVLAATAFGAAIAAPAHAAPLVGGSIFGPDVGTTITLRITNDANSTVNIKSIRLDGNTAVSFPLIWDGVGPSTGPDPSGQLVFLDEDTRVLTIEFTTAFNPGEVFTLGPMDVDGDPGLEIVQVAQLLGVEVLFTFSDNTTALFEFIDDPGPGAGLILAPVTAAIPEPMALALFGASLAGLGFARRRRDRG